MFLYTASFIQQTEIYPEKKKKIQSLEFKLDIWNQSSSASVKYAGNQEFSWKHSTPVLDRGRVGGGSPSTLFFHSCFSRLV